MRLGYFFALMAAFSLATLSSAAPLPPPNDLAAQAAKSKQDFIQATAQLEQWAPTTSDGAQLIPYLTVLESLSKSAKSFGVDITTLSLSLTHATAPFLRMNADPEAAVHSFLTWAADEDRSRMLGHQERLVKTEKDKSALLAWQAIATKSEPWLDEAEAAPEISDSLVEVHRLAVHRILELGLPLTDGEMAGVIDGAIDGPVFRELAGALRGRVLSTSDAPSLSRLFTWTLSLQSHAAALSDSLDSASQGLPGDALIDCLFKLIALRQFPAASQISSLISSLQGAQVEGLAQRLVNGFQGVSFSGDQLEPMWTLVTNLRGRVSALGLTDLSLDVDRFARIVGLNRAVAHDGLEGEYAIQFDDGEQGSVTLAAAGAMKFLAGLEYLYNGYIEVPFSFFYVSYNLDDNSIEAHYDNATETSNLTRDEFLKLTPTVQNGKNCVDGVYGDARSFHRFSGCQSQPFPPFKPAPVVSNIDGVYEGVMGSQVVQLSVTRSGENVSGGLHLEEVDQTIPLIMGAYDADHSALYLSSDDNSESQAWVQVRGQILDGGRSFVGYYIVAGRGATFSLNMGRVQ